MYAVNADARLVAARQGVDDQERGACPYGRCTARSVTSQDQRGHLKGIHGKIDAPANARARLVAARQGVYQQKPYGCPQVGCERRFSSHHCLHIHMMVCGCRNMGSPD